MIRFRDTATLALTKLRTRKIRLIITIIISGLLFAGLMGASFIARGAFASVRGFSEEGLGQRYIVSGSDVTTLLDVYNNAEIIDRSIALQKDIIARKKVEAKRLGITYDEKSETPVFQEIDTPSGKQRLLKDETAASRQAIQEYVAKHPPIGAKEFKAQAAPFGAKTYYTSTMMPYNSGNSMQVLKEGKEVFTDQQSMKQQGPPTGLDSFVGMWSLMSSDLLKPFILSGQNLQVGADGSVPIIVPTTAAEQLVGLKSLPATASSDQKLQRIKDLRAKAPRVQFGVCIRNTTSSELISEAIAVQQELERNKNDKNYQKPDLMYGLPTQPCGASPIIRDVRTKAEKTAADKERQFAELFGKPAAAQSVITFRVVGLVPDPSYVLATGASQIISSLVNSSLGTGWFTPLEQGQTQPTVAQIFDNKIGAVNGTLPTHYAEFPTATQARNFIDKSSCSPDFGGGPNHDPAAACIKANHFFNLSPFGSNNLALESIQKKFSEIFRIAAIVVAAIAAIIMMGTVGRMIADSRRETAVFRAIGAKRMDIAQIYLLYTLLLSLMISAFALLGGLAIALFAQHRLADAATIQALVAYNAQDLNRTFNLFAFYLPDILYMIGLAIIVGLLSISIPLIRNVRRNPIRDMRDDT